MSRVVRWIQRRFGQGRPTDHPALNLPDDWVAIRIPYDRQALSRAQWKAVRRLRGWGPVVRPTRRKPEELSLEEQIGRWRELGRDQETAIHIRREAIPTKRTADDTYGEARNKRALESINETLAAFPDEQIEITRVGDFEVNTESRDADQRGLGDWEDRGG